MAENSNFSKRLKELRIERNLTQQELSAETGISFPTISRYETGGRDEPKLSIMKKLANFFDVSLDYLAGESESRKGESAEEIADRLNRLQEEREKATPKSIKEVNKFLVGLNPKNQKAVAEYTKFLAFKEGKEV